MGEDALHFLVDKLRRTVRDLAALHHFAAEENLLLAVAHGDRTDDLAHAELRDHATGDVRRLLDVLRRAGRHLLGPEHQLLGHPAAIRHTEPRLDGLLGVFVQLLFRQIGRESQRAAARNDRDLVQRVGARHREAHQGVPRLVIGNEPPLLVGEHAAFPLEAQHHLVLGILEILHVHLRFVAPRGKQRRLIDDVGELRAREPRRAARDALQVHPGRHRDLARVHAQDLLASLEIGHVHNDLAVEPARPQQRRIENVGTVRGREQNHAFVRFEAVHLDEQLVQRLLALVVPSAQTGAAVAADGVDFVDEDDARRVGLALLEQVAHTRGADADEHLDEVGARHGEERPPRFTGDGFGKQRSGNR